MKIENNESEMERKLKMASELSRRVFKYYSYESMTSNSHLFFVVFVIS